MENSSVGEVSSSFFSSAVHKIPEPTNQHPQSVIDIEEGEISVFGAEKYFNMELDDDDACPRRRLYNNKYSNQIHQPQNQMTPTATSLSLSLPRQFQVKDEFGTQSFETQLDNPGKSLHVLGSNAMNKVEIANNLERKLCMLTWDAIPNAPTATTISSIYKSRYPEDDNQTEGSSDLFEIYGDADGQASESDTISSCIMTPYAPSETASIEWSVVTASAADLSFFSGYDDETKSAKSIRAPASKAVGGNGIAKEAQRSRAGGLLGCRRHKAVMVAESAYRKRW